MRMTRLLGLAVAAVLASTLPAAAQSLTTPAGALEVVDNGFYDTVLRLNGAEILHDVENQGLYVKDASADKGIVLLGVISGGSACPELQRILDTRSGKPVLSDEFGTCSDLAELSETAGAWVVSYPGNAVTGNEVWTWRDGQLTKGLVKVTAQAPVKADFSHVAKLVGEHPATLLDDVGVAARVKERWGDRAADLAARLDVASGMELIGGQWVVGSGCARSDCGWNEAFIAVGTKLNDVYAVVLTDKTDYEFRPAAWEWPQPLREAAGKWKPVTAKLFEQDDMAQLEAEAEYDAELYQNFVDNPPPPPSDPEARAAYDAFMEHNGLLKK